MKYPNVNKEIAKVVLGALAYLCFLAVAVATLHRMSVSDWYYMRELYLALAFVIIINFILFKVSKQGIESALQLLEGIDVFMKSKLENYFEEREYYIIRHGEYQAGLYFSKRPDGQLQSWEFDFEKNILEVNSNFDRSQNKCD